MRMAGELVSVRILAVFGSRQDRYLLRQAAVSATVPVEVVEADNAVAARDALAGDIDIAFLDAARGGEDRAAFIAAARSARQAPFVILVAATPAGTRDASADDAAVDGLVVKPTKSEEARSLIERCIRARLTIRVLVVDDSATIRSIVRRILAASRFRLEVAEAEGGIKAIQQVANGKFDLVFLDYDMPGLNGVETLSEIKRQYPRLQAVIMASTASEAIARRAREAGAAAFLKKPFYPADIDALLHSIYGWRS
jgi:CheY-like chemotaxis protein